MCRCKFSDETGHANHQSGHIDAIWRGQRNPGESVVAALQQRCCTLAVAALHMRYPDRQLGQGPPQFTLDLRAVLPRRLEHFVRVEGQPLIEESLGIVQ